MSKKIYVFMLTLFLSLLLFGCGTKPTLSLSETEIKLYVGEEYIINPVVTGLEGTDLVKYEVQDPSILSIEANVITALKAGQTSVTISLKEDNNIKTSDNKVTNTKKSVKSVKTNTDNIKTVKTNTDNNKTVKTTKNIKM